MQKTIDFEALPLHTNKAVAIRKEKRFNGSVKKRQLLEAGDIQGCLDSLTGKQRAFCEEYLVDLNGKEAVIRAGYKTNHPAKIAFQLLENPIIRVAVDALRAERSKMSDVTKDFVLQKIVKTLEKAEDDNNHNATLRAAELLARHLGMFVERTEISGPDGGAIELERKQKVFEEAEDFKNKIQDIRDRNLKVVGNG